MVRAGEHGHVLQTPLKFGAYHPRPVKKELEGMLEYEPLTGEQSGMATSKPSAFKFERMPML